MNIPQLLILDITHACNLHCRICDIWKSAKTEKELEVTVIKSLLTQAASLGIPEIALSGGEVLLRRDIWDLLDHARGLRIRSLGILSNGTLVMSVLPRLLPYLNDGTATLVVSLDSLKAEVHDKVRNKRGAWSATAKGMKALSELKKSYPGISFHVISIVLEQNLTELVSLSEFVFSLGADSHQFQPLLPNNMSMAQRKPAEFWVREGSLPCLEEAIAALIDLKRRLPVFIKNSEKNLLLLPKYYRGTLLPDDVVCCSAASTVLVSTRGTCTTCFGVYGDIHKQSLSEIFSSPEMGKAQQRVRQCSWPCLLPCFCDKLGESEVRCG